jgi:plastocyanin
MAKYAQGLFTPKNPGKYIGKHTPRYRSGWELTFMRFCDNHPSIVGWASESIRIPYKNPFTGKPTTYYPDFLITYQDKDGNKKAEVIKFEAKEVNGAKVWLPKEWTAKAGKPLTVEAHNSLTAPHGFKIEGYVQDQTIGAGETKSFTFTPKKSGTLKVTCHLHPAHVGAEIKVQ